MDLWRAIVLGLVQGLTEFLPVSSSGHLVLAEHLFGVDPPGVTFEVVLHLGTLLAVVLYFRRRIVSLLRELPGKKKSSDKQNGRKYLLALIVGTIPAGVIGLLFADYLETAFSSPRAAAFFLIITGLILFSTTFSRRVTRQLPDQPRAFLIGCAQAAALLPGISRSGSTIATGMFLGLSPAGAAEFSFLLSIPAILGATVLSLGQAFAEGISVSTLAVYGAGGLAAAVSGYLSLRVVFRILRQGRFWWFGLYCVVAGVAWLAFFP